MKLTFVPLLAATLSSVAYANPSLRGQKVTRELSDKCKDYELDFHEFQPGKYIDNYLKNYRLTIDIDTNENHCIGKKGMIFDTMNPTCGDTDLQGFKDKDGSDGHALIIQEKHKPGEECVPDDCAKGGTIDFKWDKPVDLKDCSIRLMDVDDPVHIQVLVKGENKYYNLPSPKTGKDGKRLTYSINTLDVIGLKLIFEKSGAIAFLKWTQCPEGPDCWGEPHFKTWSGHKYDYQGECDLVLLESQGFGAGKGLELQIRTTQEDWYSYISELAVRIGSDILQIGADGLHLLNGVAMAPLEELSGYPIYTSSFERESQKTEYWYEIAIGNASNERLRIRSYNGWLHTSLTSGMYEGLGLEDSVGLMGDWATGSMLARDGTTVINDQDAFGEEWQVHEDMLFAEARAPQFPQRCLPAPYLTTGRRKMPEAKMSREEAKILCANQHSDIEECIMDVMASGDPQMA